MIYLKYFIILLLGLSLELLINRSFMSLLLVIDIIVSFYFINRFYFNKFINYATERILFNFYTIISLIFLILISYFYFNFFFLMSLTLLMIVFMISSWFPKETGIVTVATLIITLVFYFTIQIFLNTLMVTNYKFTLNFNDISYIFFNTFFNGLIIFVLVLGLRKYLKIDYDESKI